MKYKQRARILNYFIKDEKKATREYRELAGKLKVKCPCAKTIFNKLADDEKSHERALKRVKKSIKKLDKVA